MDKSIYCKYKELWPITRLELLAMTANYTLEKAIYVQFIALLKIFY
jgi:hypothetical protein